MRKTRAEIQHAYRERKKAQEKAERSKPTPTAEPLITNPSRSFADFLKDHEANFMLPENLHWVGIELNTDLTKNVPELERAVDWEDMGLEVNALTVATSMSAIFADAAKELAELINAYKIEEIDRQMQNASPVKKEQLEALKKRLSKKTSYFLPVIE